MKEVIEYTAVTLIIVFIVLVVAIVANDAMQSVVNGLIGPLK